MYLRMLIRGVVKWMLKNTLVSGESLTPEIRLRLITEASPLWMSTPDQCPLADPYWAFYWPGGQAITRYILDNPSQVRGRSVLDFGCGCGSASIAAVQNGASHVLANDIDKNALIASQLNFRLNKISSSPVKFEEKNLLDSEHVAKAAAFLKSSPTGSLVILGDMFYDSDFAIQLFSWLKRLKECADVRVLVGDPDRHPLAEKKYVDRYPTKFSKELLHEYPLPGYITKEHYGFSTAKVFEIHF